MGMHREDQLGEHLGDWIREVLGRLCPVPFLAGLSQVPKPGL